MFRAIASKLYMWYYATRMFRTPWFILLPLFVIGFIGGFLFSFLADVFGLTF